MIPAKLDYVQMLNDLNGLGIADYKIEMICGLSDGHASRLRTRSGGRVSYVISARLYNYWCSEMGAAISLSASDACQALEMTTT